MTINDAVMNDLLTLYLAGEASPETRALVEAHARTNAAFAARLQAAGTVQVPDLPPATARDQELRALNETRQFILLRTIFFAGAILFTLLPLVFKFDGDGVQFLILGREPGLVNAFWSVAVASWVAFAIMHHRVRSAGL
ncbi:MAG TPA: zf-HC2 domain-containing protein [Vicinamibacterales bacterium]|nr:zf-HC2 domain-containing protein [Vicinamibacterales bacterium]